MDVDAPSVLKRCSSAPLINEAVAGAGVSSAPPGAGVSVQPRYVRTSASPTAVRRLLVCAADYLDCTLPSQLSLSPSTETSHAASSHSPSATLLSLTRSRLPPDDRSDRETGRSRRSPDEGSPVCFNMFSNSNQHRTRRFSASFSPLVQSPSAFMPRLTPRVNQLRKEECADVSNTREVAHEREIHTAIQMGQSWEDLTLMTPGSSGSPAPMSPTRNRFSPAVSPSPTRRSYTTRRSLSPIAIRPSCLSPVSRPSLVGPIKRRIEDLDSPSSKRMCPSDRLTPSTPGTPDSDSPIDCTFRPVSPRAPTHQPFQENHNQPNPS